MPGAISFYNNTTFPYGDLQAQGAGSVASPYPGGDTTNPEGVQSGNAGASASGSNTGVVVGLPGMTYSGGQYVPPQTNVTATESGLATVTFGGPSPTPTSNTQAITFVADMKTTDSVTADANGPYMVGGPSGGIDAGATVTATSPYQLSIRDAAGDPLTGGTVTIAFSLSLTPQQNRFIDSAALTLTSTNLSVKLGTGDLVGPPGLLVTDPATGTTIHSDPNFMSGTYSTQFTVPATATDTIGIASELVTYPDGTFNNETAVQNSDFSFTFSESISQ